MKKLFTAATLFIMSLGYAQECSEAASKETQKKLNAEYADPKHRILLRKI